MKNNKFAILSLILSIILVICAVGVPFSIATADNRDIYSYLVTSKLGSEWDAWNSKNNTNFDGDGNKIPTEEYVNIVQDPTNNGLGGVLKIGHAEYDTSLSLRVTQSTTVSYSHKYETKLYLDGAFSSDSYILAKNSDAWGTGAQNRLDLKNITARKWIDVTTEGALAGTEGLSGSAFVHVSGGFITLIFQIDLAAGNYLYMDDLSIAAGNTKTYKKNIDTTNGDKLLYTNEFDVPEDNNFQQVTEIDEWDVGDTVWAGKVADGENTEIVLYNNKAVYSGAIVQRVIGLENGTYTLSVDCRSNGHSSAVIAADGFGAAKRQLSIGAQSDEMHKVTLSNLEVTQNYMYVSIWVGGQVGEWVIVDNVTLTKEGSDENFILNGDFESEYSVTVEPVSKGKNPEKWGSWLNGMDAQTQFIANEGYKSESSMAVTYPTDGSSNFNQTVTGLTAGKTYIASAYVKFKGQGTASLYCKNWGGTYTATIPQTDVWTKIYKEVTIADGYDSLSLEFYCDAKAGDWLMVDNVKVFEKTNPSVNLLQNGDFENYATNNPLPDITVDYKANIPNWKNWLGGSSEGSFEDSVGYLVEDNNTRLAFYNKTKNFIGSINQDIPELENGEYTVSVKVRSSEYKSAVISATGYDKDNTSKKIQKSIVISGEELTEVSITVPVTNNAMMITVYVDGNAGQYIIIDDVKVTAKDLDENLVLNGDFEIKEPVSVTLPGKVADYPKDWDLWADDDNVADMFVSDNGYNSTTAFAMVNTTANSTSLNQNFSNLSDGRYVFSAFVKSSGGQNDATLVAKGWLKDSPQKTTNVKIPATKVWSRVILEIEVTSGNANLSFWNNANAGNWIIIDNAKFYRKDDPKNQLMLNGGFDEYDFYDNTPDLNVDYKANIPNWKNWLGASSEGNFEDSVGYLVEDNNTRLAFFNPTKRFIGSINQDIPELENGDYTVSVKVKASDYKSAVISATEYDKTNEKAKIQKSIVVAGDTLSEVSITVPVTNNGMMITIYVDGNAGQYIIIDEVKVTAKDSNENLVLNGDFEIKEPVDNVLPQKLADLADNWDLWADDGNVADMFVSDNGYNSTTAFAMVNTTDNSTSLNQNFSNLSNGRYVFSAFVKSSGGQNDAALVAKGWLKEDAKKTTNVKIPATNVWSRVILEIEVTSGNANLSFWNNANAGNWILIDNVKFYRKDDPKTQLLLNGGFDEYYFYEDTSDLTVDYKSNIPNWKNWLGTSSNGKFEDSVGYVTEGSNTCLAFYNKTKNFIGSINQDIPELENGEYTVSVKVKASDYKSAVISATEYDKTNTKAKIQKTILVSGEGFSEVSITVPVTNNGMMITVYADGLAGQCIVFDDVKVTAKDSDENLVLNGGFEIKEPKESTIPQKVADLAYNWSLWADDGNVSDMYVSNDGYNSETAFAMVNTTAHSTSLTQNFNNLPDGRYVFSAFVKSSGGQNDAALVAKGWLKDSPKKTTNVKIPVTNVWSRVVLEFEVTSGYVSLSLWNDANEGNWLMMDNAKFYRKDDPKNQMMLNGGFDDYASYATEFELPPRATGSKETNQKPYIDSYSDKDNQKDPNKRQEVLSPYTGEDIGFMGGLALAVIIGALSLFVIVKKNFKKI